MAAAQHDAARTRHKHEVVREYLEDLLDTLEPGAPLPSERELAERFGVARMTVRHATDQLMRSGHVNRIQGAGTFKAQHRFEQPLVLSSFTQDMTARGLVPGSRTLRHEIQPARPGVARELGLHAGDPVVLLTRLRTADGEPMAIERAYLVAAHVPGLEDRDLDDASLYEVLRVDYGIQLSFAEQSVLATVALGEDAELLGVAEGAPALHFERTSTDARGRLVEHVRSTYRGDRYRLHMTLPML